MDTKPTSIDEEELDAARREYLIREMNKALRYLQVPVIGMTLYRIAKVLKYD